VITHPVSEASEAAVDGLLEVIAAVATVSLVTANLPGDSNVRAQYDVTEVSDEGTGGAIPLAAWRFLRNQVRMCQVIRRRDEGIVLFFGATSYILPILFARMIGKRVILEPRGNVPDSLYRIWADRLPDPIALLLSRAVWVLERVGYASADAILTLSPAMSEDLGLGRYDTKLYEHGARPVDTGRFQPRTPHGERERRIGYLGRLDEEKGVDVLIDVAAHLPDDVTFAFVGDGELDRERLGLLPQSFTPAERLTARELIAYYGGLYDDARDPDAVLADVGLTDAADTAYETLSGGQQRRTCVGTALVNDPELLVLDEPTTGVDPAGRRELWGVIEGLAERGTTVVLTTHYMAEAERLADRVGLLADGRLVALGSPAELLERHGGADRLVVAVDDEGAAARALERAGYHVLPDERHLAVGVGPEEIPAVVETLADAGVDYERLTWRQPDLEDVYLALAGVDVDPRELSEPEAVRA